jgi:hypothetical protein
MAIFMCETSSAFSRVPDAGNRLLAEWATVFADQHLAGRKPHALD